MESFRNFKRYFLIAQLCDIFYAVCGKLTKKQLRLYVKRLQKENKH